MVAVRFTDWPLIVPVTVAVPLLQFVFPLPSLEGGKRIENSICPVIEPFCCRRNPPCSALAVKDVLVVVNVNCQLPPTCGPTSGGATLLPPPQLKVVKTTITSKKRQRPVASRADVLCVVRNFFSFMCSRVEFMSSQSSVLRKTASKQAEACGEEGRRAGARMTL